jgi:hypothetical protein
MIFFYLHTYRKETILLHRSKISANPSDGCNGDCSGVKIKHLDTDVRVVIVFRVIRGSRIEAVSKVLFECICHCGSSAG